MSLGVGEGSRRTAGPSTPLRSGRDDKEGATVCDRSEKRFAQDDGFVGGLKCSWLDMQKTREDRKSHRLSG
jgi:hypothetical protein